MSQIEDLRKIIKKACIERSITQEQLIRRLGIKKSTYYRKVKENGFTLSEVALICVVLNLNMEIEISEKSNH